MVNIHPFRDANGRMCRLILNAILMRYVGFVVDLGEKGVERDAYLELATESRIVGGFPGYLSKMVVEKAGETLKRLNNRLKKR